MQDLQDRLYMICLLNMMFNTDFCLTCRKRQPFTAEPTSEKEGSIKSEPVEESVEVIEKEGTQGNMESAVIGCSQVARAQ